MAARLAEQRLVTGLGREIALVGAPGSTST
jgi:hypothetical protein